MGAALALPDDQLTAAAGALAGVYRRHRETALGHECLLHLRQLVSLRRIGTAHGLAPITFIHCPKDNPSIAPP